MAVRNTYSMENGRPAWVESMGDAQGQGMEARNTFQTCDETDSVSLHLMSEVIGMFAPNAEAQLSVRITYDDTRKLVDHLTEILNRREK